MCCAVFVGCVGQGSIGRLDRSRVDRFTLFGRTHGRRTHLSCLVCVRSPITTPPLRGRRHCLHVDDLFLCLSWQ